MPPVAVARQAAGGSQRSSSGGSCTSGSSWQRHELPHGLVASSATEELSGRSGSALPSGYGSQTAHTRDAATARLLLPDGLARDSQVFELLGELEPLHPRNDTFPGEVFLHLAADALDWCRASRTNPVQLEGLQARGSCLNLRFAAGKTRNSSTQS